MKRSFPAVVVLAAAAILASVSNDAFAKPKHKSAPQTEPETPPQSAPQTEAGILTQQLAPYIEHLDELFALQRSGSKNDKAFCDAAPGKLVILKTSFLAQRPAAAPADQPAVDAAVAACDKITAALDERQKVVAQYESSKPAKSSATLGLTRKETLGQGIHGGDLAKAVGTVEEAKRERGDAKAAKKRAADDEGFLSASVATEWNQRTVALHQEINVAFQQIAAPPAPAQPAPAAGPAPAPVSAQ